MDTYEIFVLNGHWLDNTYQFAGKSCNKRARLWFDSIVNDERTRVVYLRRIRTDKYGIQSHVILAHYRRNTEAWLRWDERAIAARRASVSCAQAGILEAMQDER